MTDAHRARLKRLRDSGNKLTQARLTVLNVLETYDGHPTSADVLEAVEAADSAIGRASVFRALDLFTSLNIIRPTYIGDSKPRYVLMPDGHHHHIVCLNCSQTIEFEDCGLGNLQTELETRFGVRLTGHLLEFYGLCANCR